MYNKIPLFYHVFISWCTKSKFGTRKFLKSLSVDHIAVTQIILIKLQQFIRKSGIFSKLAVILLMFT